MFSQTVEYALRAIVHLADQSPNPCTTEQIAKATKVPQAYLSKVLQSLRQSQIVHSQRGIGGGISLVKTPDALNLLEVVNAVDPICRIKTCPLGLKGHGANLCPLHRKLDDAMRETETAFSETSLADILSSSTSSYPLCNEPHERLTTLEGSPALPTTKR
ncbi:RrF2 family transcriptional regulator [Gimesia aquarii]|uniref:HTH-type transcriptional repressor NsrR n=1 Tax=Gimesia aquarii TaxID=2527964 RepID=A0A517W4I9_9PLAN|nr:Rrf2 family transcriptional regulator [Gimesia aquarii]QDU00177.1 HTH-type transcriptional repressor NsrR [Gimesia aquarii]